MKALVSIAVVLAAASPAHAAPPLLALDRPAFTAPPAELLAAARAVVAPGTPARVVLREERELSLDEQGRFTFRLRVVSVVRTKAGLDELAAFVRVYRPSFQDRPQLRARVIDPSGAVTPLDPAKVFEEPMPWPEYRRVRAELPLTQLGSVIEAEAVLIDRAPQLGPDATEALLTYDAPVAEVRLRLSAPAARRARIVAHNLPSGIQPSHELVRGRDIWTLAYPQLDPLAPADEWSGPDGSARPYVALGAGTWSGVAQAYSAILARALAAGPPVWPAAVPRAATADSVRAIVRWVHAHVATSNRSLVDSPLVPASPAATIARRAGASAEKALLIAALLRQAGLRAEVALLDPGPGRDLDVELPGFLWFDRALVRAEVGGRELWIDPLDPFARPGVLASELRGRRALIAAAATTGLVVTPAAAPSDNLVRQVRTYEAAEIGQPRRVTEVSREGGEYELSHREWLRTTSAEQLRPGFERYVEDEYLAKLDAWRSTPADDLDTPLELTVTTGTSARMVALRDKIEVFLFPSDALEKVPPLLKTAPAVGEAPRHQDFYWRVPHVMEIECRVVVPDGYTLPALEPDTRAAIGPATLTTRRRIDGRTLVVTYRFDSGKARLSPREVLAVRTAIAELPDAEKLVLEHTGFARSSAGRPAEAIAEAQRMIRLHPGHALHHSELALIYLEIGMGMAARRAARRATEVEPTSADAHSVLGHVLRHDSLGRDRGFDHDRAGALAAIERALVLDPKHLGALRGRVEVLEHTAGGFEIGDDERPRLIQAMRARYAHDRTTGEALVRQLLHVDPQEAARVAGELPPGAVRDALLVAAAAAGPRGAAEALRLAGTLATGAARTALIGEAARSVGAARLYEPMRGLLAEPGVPTALAPDVWSRVRRETPRPVGGEPAELWFALQPWWVERGPGPYWDAETQAEADATLMPKALVGFGRATWIDLSRAAAKVQVSGTEAAWRIDVEAWGTRTVLFAAAERGVAKLIGFQDTPAGVARHVLRLIGRGDLAAATQLLDWIAPFAPADAALATVWGAGRPRDRETIALAAQLLSIAAGTPVRDLSAAVRCASPAANARGLCDRLLAAGYERAQRWSELAAHGAAWAARGGGTDAGIARAAGLRGLRRFDEADRALAVLAAADPANLDVERERVRVAAHRRDHAEAARRADAVAARATTLDGDHDSAAWLHLFTGADLAASRAQLARAIGTPDPAVPRPIHTLAALDAELGNLGEAKRLGWLADGEGTRRAPGSRLWYLAARIAEQLGLRDDAIAMYRKVRREGPIELDSYDLAQRGLARLAGQAP